MESPQQTIPQGDTLWPLTLELAEGLRAASDNEGRFFVEKTATSEKFLLQAWQMSFMAAFDGGDKTVAESVREVMPRFPAEVTEINVRQFCQWLLDERLMVIPETNYVPPLAVVDEIVPDEVPPEDTEPQINPIARSTMQKKDDPAPKRFKKPKIRRKNGFLGNMMRAAACIAVGIGTWKFAHEIGPLVKGNLGESKIFAGAIALESDSSSAAVAMPVAPAIEVNAVDEVALEAELDELRSELEENQEIRDRCYTENDEDGYRMAVQTIAHLTHEIGSKQAKLSTLNLKVPGIAYGEGTKDD